MTRRILAAAIAVLSLAVGARASAADDRERRVVVLPFDNFSGVETAPDELRRIVMSMVTEKGWTVAPNEQVEQLLETERVRYLDSLDDAVRGRILDAAGATAVISGSIYSDSGKRNPVVALSARMVSANGTILWGDVAGLSADDTATVMGFGRQGSATGVALKTVAHLLRDFPKPSGKVGAVRGPGKPVLKRGATSFVNSDVSGPMKVCIVPFDNSSDVPEATRVVADVLALRLAAERGFEVIEPATMRAAALEARIGSFRWITTEDLAKLSTILGTSLFIRGTIFNYADGMQRGSDTPEIDMELTLVDVRAPRVLWTVQHERRGADYAGFLMLGAVSNVVSLTDHVVTEMIETGAGRVAGGGTRVASSRSRDKKMPERHSSLRGPSQGDNR